MSFSTLVEWALVVWVATTAVGLTSSPVLLARENNPAAVELESESQAVSEGNRLRSERHWAEAIDFYEKAAKKWPENDSLKLGLRQAKIHFSVERRYSDRSFLNAMLPLSRPEALAYLDDVLDKVRKFYVDPVTPTSFVAHGTESLYFALANEKFLQRNLPNADSNKVTSVRRTLRNSYWNKQVANQDQARRTVIELSDLTQYELGLAPSAVVMEFVFGGCNSLDDYSSYLTPGKLGDLYNNIDGEFVGIGIEMKSEPGKGLLLVNVLPESPAEEGGAQPGDYIVKIENVDVRKMSTEEAASLLQGTAGSRLRLTLSDPKSQERPATLIRRAVKVKSIPVAKIIDRANGIGYIKMSGFQKNTTEELDAALLKLNADGMRALIWDVRGNPGGLLTSAVEVLDRFIGSGVLVSTRGRSHDQDSTYSANEPGTWKMPLVLLTDGDSASASEIVAGAIHDHHRGTIVGRKTYGKWSVQSILPCQAESGFRLTTARFYSPSGRTYGKIGIKPDIEVAADESSRSGYRGRRGDIADGDRDIESGMDVLRKQMAKR